MSIATPSYNQARFLPETMRSVLDQRDVTCDYVVQDGGSTDGSAALIEEQAKRLRAYAIAPDHGQSDAIAKDSPGRTADRMTSCHGSTPMIFISRAPSLSSPIFLPVIPGWMSSMATGSLWTNNHGKSRGGFCRSTIPRCCV
ncbi:MAG: glycosyltransferase [Lacunisphaera sp.]